MSLGSVMVDLEGVALTEEERELLKHPAVGGVILFQRNFQDAAQLTALTAQIHRLREPHLLIAVDQEGGRVQRFLRDFTRLPPLRRLGTLAARDRERARRAARQLGWLMAVELRAAGLDFSFAPVLDLDRGRNTVIGDRAFSQNPNWVAELGIAWCAGARQLGMASVGKHFPGHGGVSADSHTELPRDPRTLVDIEMADLIPFARLIEGGLEAIMPAHVVYEKIDPRPAGFSRFWLDTILRKRLGFQGALFSDDLNMAAAAAGGDYGTRAREALAAGCDMVLICNNRPAAWEIVQALVDHEDPASHLRCLRMHGRGAPPERARLPLDPRWQAAVRLAAQFEEGDSRDLDPEPCA